MYIATYYITYSLMSLAGGMCKCFLLNTIHRLLLVIVIHMSWKEVHPLVSDFQATCERALTMMCIPSYTMRKLLQRTRLVGADEYSVLFLAVPLFVLRHLLLPGRLLHRVFQRVFQVLGDLSQTILRVQNFFLISENLSGAWM